MLQSKPQLEDSDLPLISAASLKIYNPGAVVIYPGVYRVQHSMNHRPDTETYIEAGLFLPQCNILGCHVHYMLIRRVAFEIHIIEKQHHSG